MMPDATTFMAIGECMVELSPTGDATYAMAYAGDTFNTAWYLRHLLPEDWQVSYLTALGLDRLSDSLVSFIQSAGISTDNIARIEGKSPGLYMIHLNQGERSFSYWRENSAARLLASDLPGLEQALQKAGTIYFSGITMAILPEEGRKNLLMALNKARAGGSRIIFDPNLRPALWPDTKIMCREIEKAAAISDIVLPSFDDEAQFFGDATTTDTLNRYLALGVDLAVVKNGSGEILAGDQKGIRHQHTPAAIPSPTDTTAAGDAFNAAFLASLLTGKKILDAIKTAAALSAKVIQQRGALVDPKQAG